MPNLRGVRDRISELLLANYALTGNAEWIGIRDRANTIFAVQPPTTAASKAKNQGCNSIDIFFIPESVPQPVSSPCHMSKLPTGCFNPSVNFDTIQS